MKWRKLPRTTTQNNEEKKYLKNVEREEKYNWKLCHLRKVAYEETTWQKRNTWKAENFPE